MKQAWLLLNIKPRWNKWLFPLDLIFLTIAGIHCLRSQWKRTIIKHHSFVASWSVFFSCHYEIFYITHIGQEKKSLLTPVKNMCNCRIPWESVIKHFNARSYPNHICYSRLWICFLKWNSMSSIHCKGQSKVTELYKSLKIQNCLVVSFLVVWLPLCTLLLAKWVGLIS